MTLFEGGPVVLPQDRTLKTPTMAFCRNPECAENGREFNFIAEHDHPKCPKCGANREPMIGTLTLTHWLIKHPQGPITGSGGVRFAIACDQRRAYLATATNQEAVTDNRDLVNCPNCLQVKDLESKTLIFPVSTKSAPKSESDCGCGNKR